MHRFCGVAVGSERAFPDLLRADAPQADVYLIESGAERAIAWDPFNVWTLADDSPWAEFARDGSGSYRIRFPQFGDFIVRDATVEWHARSTGVDDRTIRHLFLNQVMPLVLARTGRLMFHASAVDLGSRSIAFAGVSGAGKSTLAGALVAAGYSLMTDDCLLVQEAGGAPYAVPSYPGLRLWEDSAEVVLPPGTDPQAAASYTSKLKAGLTKFSAGPVKLAGIYVLDRGGDEVRFERLAGLAAFTELVKFQYVLDPSEAVPLRKQFAAIGRIAAQPIVWRLVYPSHFDALPQVVAAIERHVSTQL